jgi:hypothetical protein
MTGVLNSSLYTNCHFVITTQHNHDLAFSDCDAMTFLLECLGFSLFVDSCTLAF